VSDGKGEFWKRREFSRGAGDAGQGARSGCRSRGTARRTNRQTEEGTNVVYIGGYSALRASRWRAQMRKRRAHGSRPGGMCPMPRSSVLGRSPLSYLTNELEPEGQLTPRHRDPKQPKCSTRCRAGARRPRLSVHRADDICSTPLWDATVG